MESGRERAATDHDLTATVREQPGGALRDLPIGWRCLSSVSVLLVALAIGVAATAAWSSGVLTVTAAVLLIASGVGMATLSIGLGWLSERELRRQCRALRQAVEAGQRHVDEQRVRQAWLADTSVSLQQAGHPAELAQRLLSGLARAVTLHQGLCCYWDETSQVLQLAARYGGDGADANAVLMTQPSLAPLLLEVARSRRTMVIANPGSDYLRISSGLGDADPVELVVLPLEYQGRLVAVLELAALEPIGDAARALMLDIVPIFALCLAILSGPGHGELPEVPRCN